MGIEKLNRAPPKAKVSTTDLQKAPVRVQSFATQVVELELAGEKPMLVRITADRPVRVDVRSIVIDDPAVVIKWVILGQKEVSTHAPPVGDGLVGFSQGLDDILNERAVG